MDPHAVFRFGRRGLPGDPGRLGRAKRPGGRTEYRLVGRFRDLSLISQEVPNESTEKNVRAFSLTPNPGKAWTSADRGIEPLAELPYLKRMTQKSD